MGPDGHVLTFPIAHGEKLNIVAFRTTSEPWVGEKNTRPSSREDALRDFKDFGKSVKRMFELTEEEPSVVSSPSQLERPRVPSACSAEVLEAARVQWLNAHDSFSGPFSTLAITRCLPSTRAASAYRATLRMPRPRITARGLDSASRTASYWRSYSGTKASELIRI